MATLKQAKTEDDIKKLTIAGVKKEYNSLASDYNKMINLDYVYCPECGQWITRTNFYTSNQTKSGIVHLGCKKCLMRMATDYDKVTNTYTDNKERTKETLKKMDLPFIESLYNSAVNSVQAEVNEKNRSTAWQQYMVMIRSLPQYRGLSWKDSEIFGIENEIEEEKVVQKTVRAGRKRFGAGYSNEDLMFLEKEYEDWVSRYECNQKAQEEVFESLCLLKLQKKEAIKNNKSTKDIDASYQQWLDTGNLKPKQNVADSLSNAQTFGTLIQKYEETRPLPEIDPELQDVDKIGVYIDAFYRGHASKMLGLKNRFSHLYEKVMSKYTVKQPKYNEETDSEILFEKIFGSSEEE